ncbi:UNVERIFIED_CONTAM: Zeaxanthin epoxidase, chloroplastic [Sesamum radiatum]|uniref:Zeaxanthin epoxidase, chloroplastic n=1 Tax=Sesamum radiatum TaxID=300843 RepID=A0AAW2V743_SESRA
MAETMTNVLAMTRNYEEYGLKVVKNIISIMAYLQSLSLNVCPQSLRLRGFRQRRSSKGLMSEAIKCESRSGTDGKKLKILIAGGGIAGLVFALAAKRSGFDVRVFEKDFTAVRGEGRQRGPIQLLCSALALLERIDRDVAREVMEAGYVTGDRNNGLADGKTGEWFVKYDFLTPAVVKGVPVTRVICRMELQSVVVNAVGEDAVINNSKVVDFVSDAHKVTVFLENGQQYEGDILVGADGLRSTVRSKLFGPQEPKYKVFLGTNQFLVALDIGKGRMQWYAFVKEARESPVFHTGNKNMLLQRYRDWCDEVVTVIRKTPEDTIMRRPIYDQDMIASWGRDRVILVGDAAHAMLPNLGQGGSMAIEDCYWLMVELQNLVAQTHPMLSEISSDELDLAFRRFEKKRMFRVRTVHSICRMASFMISLYQTHLQISLPPPLPLLFNDEHYCRRRRRSRSMKVKHPALFIANQALLLALPKFMDWVVVGQH